MIRNVALGIILVVQLVIWLIAAKPFADEGPRSDVVATRHMTDISLDDVASITIQDASKHSLHLQLEADRWRIQELEGFPAIPAKIQTALDSLKDLSSAEFRSSNAIMHGDYEVDAEAGRHVILKRADGSEIAHFIIGKRDFRGGGTGTFLRLADSDDVYVKQGQALAAAFSTEPKTWAPQNVMGIDPMDQARVTDLRNACFKIEVEGKARKRDDKGRFVNPVEWEYVRYVYEKTDEKNDDGETVWRVREPAGLGDLEIWEQPLKGMVGALLGIRWNEIIGTAVKPEYKLSDPTEAEGVVVAHFNENGQETTYRLTIGAQHEHDEIPGKPRRADDRYAMVSHPNDPLLQQFVFTIHNTFHTYFTRDPHAMVKRTPPKKAQPKNNPAKKDGKTP